MSFDPRAMENLLGFWADAGVDAIYADAPVAPLLAPAHRDAPSLKDGRVEPANEQAASGASGLIDALAEARRLAQGAGDLSALQTAISAFEGCTLKASARHAVFARGRSDAPVMVIGEAPAAEDDAEGTPFVGRAGRLLDMMLRAAGLDERVFITNTVFWRPPGDRTPTLTEQALCAPFIERAIALIAPRLLLLLGGAAARSMLGRSEGILSLRGRWLEWRTVDGASEIPALATLHPEFLLRQPSAKRRSWEDMLTLAERLDRPSRPD